MGILGEVLLSLVTSLGSVVLTGWVVFAVVRWSGSDRAVSAERTRLRTEILGQPAEQQAVKSLMGEALAKTFADPEVSQLLESLNEAERDRVDNALSVLSTNLLFSLGAASLSVVDTTKPGDETRTIGFARRAQTESLLADSASAAARDAPSSESERFTLLLIEYYAYGLVQAKRSLAASLASSAVGGLVLIGGVVLALAKSNAGVTAPIVTSLAGVLTSGIGALFHRQASQALKHMEGQSRTLREDMKAERDQTLAVNLLDDVEDTQLQAQLQAALILKLTGAKLPEAGTDRSQRTANGSLPRQAAGQEPTASGIS
jgi:hypothetical protein